jgi:hypothetical protein
MELTEGEESEAANTSEIKSGLFSNILKYIICLQG